MAEISITTGLDKLRVLFNSMKNVYYNSTANAALASLAKFDMELPVLDDGVTFNTGDASVTRVKLTTQAEWTSIADAGDSDISFQVASVAGEVTELLMGKKTSTPVTMTNTIGGVAFKGDGFSTEPKKVTGSLFLTSQDGSSAIYLPNIEAYASFVSESDKPAYFNVNVTPLADANGANMYMLAPSE